MELPTFSFDFDLHERADDSAHLRHYISHLKRRLHGVFDPVKHVRRLGELADYLRIAGQLDEAEQILKRALMVARDSGLGVRFEVCLRVRMAQVWQAQHVFERSTREFTKLISICEGDERLSDLRDLAWHSAGINLFEQGRYNEALVAFEWALALREERGADQDLIEASRLGVSRAYELMSFRPSSNF